MVEHKANYHLSWEVFQKRTRVYSKICPTITIVKFKKLKDKIGMVLSKLKTAIISVFPKEMGQDQLHKGLDKAEILLEDQILRATDHLQVCLWLSISLGFLKKAPVEVNSQKLNQKCQEIYLVKIKQVMKLKNKIHAKLIFIVQI